MTSSPGLQAVTFSAIAGVDAGAAAEAAGCGAVG